MANLMHRLLRTQSCLRAIPKLTPNLIPYQKPCVTNVEPDPVLLTNPVVTLADQSLRFYPSFPIGYGFNFNPSVVFESGLIKKESFVVEEKEIVIYADSVKKKRKTKMNKHKYRKLRKLLGRKTKS